MKYEAVIGLEVHAQLLTESKIFCGCPTRSGSRPNVNVCPVCMGLPGALPVLNRKAVEFATRTALALNCRINERSSFARKNYFYPDLPKGYQITQYEAPLATGGWLEYQDGEERAHRVSVLRIHLEEDAGKSLHEGFDDSDRSTYVDFNRAGVPLVEIVSGPDLRSPRQAALFLRELRAVLQFLDVCDGNMERGSLRCDANISLRPEGSMDLGARTEIKNLNSFRFLQRALEAEIERQTLLLESGRQVRHETLMWDARAGATVPMRAKEGEDDYRYFPEPDLPHLEVNPGWQEGIRNRLPELPAEVRDRFRREYDLPRSDVGRLTRSRDLASYFERTAAASGNPRAASNWIASELLREVREDAGTLEAFPVRPGQLADLIHLIDEGRITGRTAKGVFQKMCETGQDPHRIVEEGDLGQISGPEALEPLVRQVVAEHPEAVKDYRSGSSKVKGYLVGEVMKKTCGRANPSQVQDLLSRALEG